MRVVSWNMGAMPPASAYRADENRRRQWEWLAQLDPDLALLQECRPDDLGRWPSATLAGHVAVGALEQRWNGCSAIIARSSLAPRELRPSSAEWRALHGYVVAAELRIADRRVLVASVHARAERTVDPELRQNALPGFRDVWPSVVAARAIEGERRSFEGLIAGGDWNESRSFDATGRYEPGASAAFFVLLTKLGWCESMRKFHADEIATYGSGASARELDHLFTDAPLHAALAACRVVREPRMAGLSDHDPIVAELSVD